ncbi:hypothetical protein JHK82_033733 [Glycine max]|nr:hypothetical protein JHK82_033733 [Glycine max]
MLAIESGMSPLVLVAYRQLFATQNGLPLAGNLPTAEEYLKNGIVSSGVHIAMIHTFFQLGHGLTEENVKIID